MLGLFRKRRRARLLARPLPPAWWAVIDRHSPAVTHLSADERDRLGGIVRVLLDEKRFEGCAGLAMTDEIRVTIAAQAALLVLNRPGDYYAGLRSVLVYPASYRAWTREQDEIGIVTEGVDERLGEAWEHGAVVLSWADVVRGGENDHDGHNVVLHEFAHLLDAQEGDMNGAPLLSDRAGYGEWSRVFSAAYEGLVRDVRRGRRSLLDPYGAEHPAEFFAVATEVFFERPVAMRREHPDLYRELAGYYGQDPAERATRAGGVDGADR